MLHPYHKQYRTTDGQYQVVRLWADIPGWTLLKMNGHDAEVLDTFKTLRAAVDDIERRREQTVPHVH